MIPQKKLIKVKTKMNLKTKIGLVQSIMPEFSSPFTVAGL